MPRLTSFIEQPDHVGKLIMLATLWRCGHEWHHDNRSQLGRIVPSKPATPALCYFWITTISWSGTGTFGSMKGWLVERLWAYRGMQRRKQFLNWIWKRISAPGQACSRKWSLVLLYISIELFIELLISWIERWILLWSCYHSVSKIYTLMSSVGGNLLNNSGYMGLVMRKKKIPSSFKYCSGLLTLITISVRTMNLRIISRINYTISKTKRLK